MQFQIARLQEIITKVQFSCKMNFKNSVDVEILLEIEGLELADVNKLVSAGIKRIGVFDFDAFLDIKDSLLPCRKAFVGEIDESKMEDILNNFDFLQNVVSLECAEKLSNLNAKRGKTTDFALSVNLVNKEKKYGILPEEFDSTVIEILKLSGLRLRGLNIYCPSFGNQLMEKKLLRKAGVLYKLLDSRYKGIELYSVNMVGKVEEMINEGVNEIRIGLNSLV